MFAVTLSDDRIASNTVAVRLLTGDLKPRRIQITVHPADRDDPLSDLEGDFEAARKAQRARLERMAAPFERETPALFTVPWRSFTPELLVDLGSGEGVREITVSAEWDSGPILFQSQTLRVRVDHTPPLIVVTNPVTRVTSQPVVQIEGYSDEPLVAVQAALGTNSLILNTRQPACGTFRLHLSGTAGRSFVLLASTNLTDWTPVLTNVNSEAVFDFVDTNVLSFGCRFFRVWPLP